MYRSGIGYDLHRTAEGRRLVLGGVEIPADRGLIGHSDADVVLHALSDAMLGAAGMPDIGEWFPDTDPTHKDADSIQLLKDIHKKIRGAGFEIENLDLVIHAEQPRLGPFKPRIREKLAELLGLPASSVGVKATTNEGLDAVGRGEAIACFATVLLRATG